MQFLSLKTLDENITELPYRHGMYASNGCSGHQLTD